MSARSRGHSVGKLVQRFESAAPGTAKIRSQPKSHPLAFIFARWWRAVQPHEKLHLPKADVADSRSVRSTVSPSWKGEAAEEPHLSSTGTPSQDSGSQPSSSSRGEEALVTAARRFLAEHRASGSSALSAIAIRLDADSDDESEEKGARDVLAAAKLYAHLQHLSGSLPDAFCASLGELWTSPPQEMQPASWRPSQDSMALSETAKEDWRSISAAAELESAHEVIKDQRELLQLEQLHREELEKKILDLEDTIKSKQKQAAEEQLRGDELEEKLQDQRDFLQLEQIQRAELEKKILDLEEVIKSTQKRKEEEQLRRDDLENKLQDRIEELQKKIGDMEELIKSKQKRKEEEQLRREEADNKLQDQREELKQKIRDLEDGIKSKQKRNEEEQLRRDEKERELQEALRQEQMKCQGLEVEVESLVSQLGQCSEEMSELQRCRDELTAVLQERQALLDALAENEALLVELEDASDVSAADALRQAAAALTELRRRLASSEAQKRQLERQCEKLEAQTEEDFQSLQRHRERAWEQAELEDPIRAAWNAGKLRSGLPSDLQESINLPNEVLSAADLAAHLRGGLQTSHTQGAHCRALVERVNALQKERDAMASEVREALALCGRAARAAREARR